jgi:acetylornithine deacetylase/succinyl-diaminopimelate desuccinylase-like protein
LNRDPVQILKQLVRFPTYQVTLDKVEKGMEECAAFLSEALSERGFEVKVDEVCNVTGERVFEGGEKTFLINAHFDTVPPSTDWQNALSPEVCGTRLYGLGASDDKGSIAGILSTLSHLQDCRFAKLIVQFVNYEDNALERQGRRILGVPFYLANNPEFKADYGVNVESTVVKDKWALSIGCTGRLSFTVKTIGKEAHSSTPKLGRNAIYDMVNVINAIRQVPPGRFHLDEFDAEMPINVGLIEGGRAINIVPSECKITCERRLFPKEDPKQVTEIIRATLKNTKGANVQCDFNPNVQLPYYIDKNEEVVSLASNSISQTVGYKPQLRIELGRTDSTYLYHNAGIKTAIIGPGHMGHTEGEYINTDRLREFTEILRKMLRKET